MATEIEKLTKNVDTAVRALAVSVGSIVGDEDLDDDEKHPFSKRVSISTRNICAN
jgi:hypothetical protein